MVRRSSRTSSSITNCWASWLSSAATCSSGACEEPRVGDPEGDRALHRELLEVGRAGVEEERQLAIVDRDLGHRGVDRAEPEREPGAVAGELAAAVVQDVRGRLGTQVTEEGIGGDLGHGDCPLRYWSVRPI
jgi:hypothetical protein